MSNTISGPIERLDPRLDALVPPNASLEVLADGFNWVEGPVWDKANRCLLFSDVPANAIYRWDRESGVRLFMQPSGYTGDEPFTGREPGSNGLVFDPQGRLTICEHGDRRIRRLEPDGSKTVLADRYQGRRLNSPNDAVYRSNGDLYFTDPPFGLPQQFDDLSKELPFSGVYCLSASGALALLLNDLTAPNGIAFAPDEKTLYVTDSAPNGRPAWLAYAVQGDGSLGDGRVLFDATGLRQSKLGAPDGLEVDRLGHIFGAGFDGVYIFTPDGAHLGTILTGSLTANVAWGEDGSTLFITADKRLLRLRLSTKGVGF